MIRELLTSNYHLWPYTPTLGFFTATHLQRTSPVTLVDVNIRLSPPNIILTFLSRLLWSWLTGLFVSSLPLLHHGFVGSSFITSRRNLLLTLIRISLSSHHLEYYSTNLTSPSFGLPSPSSSFIISCDTRVPVSFSWSTGLSGLPFYITKIFILQQLTDKYNSNDKYRVWDFLVRRGPTVLHNEDDEGLG